VRAKSERARIAHEFAGEKPATEILVLNEEFFAANFERFEELRVVTIAAEPQADLYEGKQDKRQQ
jgi:hypothetical protein